VHVPVYANLGQDEYEHIMTHSDAKMVIISSDEVYERIRKAVDKASNIKEVYSVDPVDGLKNWNEIIELGKKNAGKYKDKLQKIKAGIKPDDVMSIIYTSGTTGLSKGVMLSHRNFIANVEGSLRALRVAPEGKFLSFLPLCHVFERMVNYLVQ